MEVIESGRIEAGPFGTVHHSGFFCCSQMALTSLFSYLPFHNQLRHSRKRFLFGVIIELLVKRERKFENPWAPK